VPLPPLARFAGAVAFLLPVVFSPSVQATFWTPAAALCLVVAAVGLPRLVRHAARDRTADAAAAFVAVALASALLADNRTLSFFGLYGWGTGFLFVACLGGAWAVGRSLSEAGVTLVERAVVAAVLVNAVVAVLEMALDLSALHLGKVADRAPGLLGNPVHLGGLAGASIVLVAPRVADRPRRWFAAPLLVAAAVQVSGSRAGLGILVLGTAIASLPLRGRIRVLLAGLVVAGLLGGAALADVGGGTSVTNRVQGVAGSSGVTARAETWEAAARSMPDHPVVGIGPGLFRDAVAPRRTLELARAEGSERLFVDAHNIVVEYATTTGVVGLLAFAVWLVLAVRGARGPLLWFALLLLVNHLVAPQAVRTTPVLLLALGAAAVPRDGRWTASTRALSVATAATSIVAVIAAGTFLIGDFHLEQGRLDFVHSHARSALDLLPRWAEPALLEGRIYLFDERVRRRPEDAAAALRWLREAAGRDLGNPATWAVLGENLLAQGHQAEGRRALLQALVANPTSVRAMNDLGIAAMGRGDDDEARAWFRRSLRIKTVQPEIRRRLDAIGGGP
jgi:O-antigen ligase